MLNQIKSLQRYGVAIASVIVALLLMLVLDPILHLTQASFLLFFGAVTISAFYGGRGPGVAATLLSALFANYYFLPPLYSWVLSLAGGLRMVLFILEGFLISLLVGSLRVVQEQIRQNFRQLQATEAEIKDLNRALQRQINEMQTLFNVIPINIAIAEDPDGRFIKINPAFSKLLKLPHEVQDATQPLHQTSDLSFKFYQEGQELVGEHLPQQYVARSGVELRDLELDIIRNDGVAFSLYGDVVPLLDESGNPGGSVGAFVDISDRKRMETALRKLVECSKITGSAYFEAVVRILAELFQVRYAYVGELLSYPHPQIKTLSVWENGKLGEVFTYDLANTPCEQVLQRQQTCFYSHDVSRLFPHDELITTLGIESYVGTSLHASNGEILGILCILHDQPLDEQLNLEALLEIFAGKTAAELQRERAITALRQSEKRYRYLTESIPQLVWTADASGTLVDVNQRWSNFTGLTLTQVQEQGWQTVVHAEDVPVLSQSWAMAQQAGTNYQAEGRMRRADGVYRWHLHQAVPLQNELGQVIKWFGTATDIEDVKQMEQQRSHLLEREQAAREAAERANQIKDEFLAVLSHELRSPLNPILGWSKLLQTRKLSHAKTAEALAIIERNARVQTQLIDDLLDVAKILRGKLSLSMSAVMLSSVIEAAMDTVKSAAEAKSIELKASLPNIGLVSGDPARLQQVVWNLLSNAIKFTPNYGEVSISLESCGDQAQIIVKDTGKGISPAFLPFVFESFRQEDASITRRFGGLGLGLAIVRHLVALHGGTIQVDSLGEDLGSTFIVILPLRSAPSAVAQIAQGKRSALNLTGIQILVVDDEEDSRDFTMFLLQQAGARVMARASADEAFQVLTQSCPDIVVSDIGMQDMDGYRLMEQIRALPPDQGGATPAIALTAFAREADQKQALAVGFQRHLAKPVDPEALIQAILSLVKSP